MSLQPLFSSASLKVLALFRNVAFTTLKTLEGSLFDTTKFSYVCNVFFIQSLVLSFKKKILINPSSNNFCLICMYSVPSSEHSKIALESNSVTSFGPSSVITISGKPAIQLKIDSSITLSSVYISVKLLDSLIRDNKVMFSWLQLVSSQLLRLQLVVAIK